MFQNCACLALQRRKYQKCSIDALMERYCVNELSDMAVSLPVLPRTLEPQDLLVLHYSVLTDRDTTIK